MHRSGATLERSISTPLLTLYGIGTMLGAGIYALIGEVTGAAGTLAPLAFLVAATLAGLTATSFAELSSRYPKSAGEATYVAEAFSIPSLSLLVGLLIVLSGIVSSGVMLRGFVGYSQSFVAVPDLAIIAGCVFVLGGLAVWGIGESLLAIAIITFVEAGVLLAIVALGLGADTVTPPPAPKNGGSPIFGVLTASVLAFYAFIGFEDMVNIAEEVKQPRRAMPIAIFTALAVTTVIYLAVIWIAIRTTPIDALAASDAPMTLVFTTISDWPAEGITAVALFAVANGALVQIVMASRVLYGLSQQGLLPSSLGSVHPLTRTPVKATLLVAVLIAAAATFQLALLAKITSFLLLTVFTLINFALIRVKHLHGNMQGAFSAPWFMPWLGAFSSAIFAVISLLSIITSWSSG